MSVYLTLSLLGGCGLVNPRHTVAHTTSSKVNHILGCISTIEPSVVPQQVERLQGICIAKQQNAHGITFSLNHAGLAQWKSETFTPFRSGVRTSHPVIAFYDAFWSTGAIFDLESRVEDGSLIRVLHCKVWAPVQTRSQRG